MMWSESIGNHVYVFHNGQVIYKRTPQSSILFNDNGWPNVRLPKKDLTSDFTHYRLAER